MSDARQPRDVDVIVGSNVRKLRAKLNLSQTQLADAIGVTFQQVQKYEKGTNRMGASRLHEVATSLGTTIEKLFEGIGQPESGNPNPQMSAIAIRCAFAFDRIQDEKVRQRVAGLINALAGDADIAA